MNIIELTSLDMPEVAVFAGLNSKGLRVDGSTSQRVNGSTSLQGGCFITESPKVIRVALDAGYEPVSLLMERRHVTGDAADIIARCGEIPVYTGERDLLARLTGYTLTRGVLCAMRRPEPKTVEEVLQGAGRVCIIDGVCDSTNIGAIFRSAAALGIDGVLVTPDSCDPLNRRAVRVSMGSVFLVPWTYLEGLQVYGSTSLRGEGAKGLRDFGFKTVAMALTDDSVPIDAPELKAEPRLAIILGTEGDGLSHKVIDSADYVARIPMAYGVDSLNVAAASAVAFWELRK